MESWGMLESQAGTKSSQVTSTMAKISAEEQHCQGDTALLLGMGHSHWQCHHWVLDIAEALPWLHTVLGTNATEHLIPLLLE